MEVRKDGKSGVPAAFYRSSSHRAERLILIDWAHTCTFQFVEGVDESHKPCQRSFSAGELNWFYSQSTVSRTQGVLMVDMCDMTIWEGKQLECVHDPPLHRDCLHYTSVHVLSVAALDSDTEHTFFLNQITLFAAPLCSMPPIDTHK